MILIGIVQTIGKTLTGSGNLAAVYQCYFPDFDGYFAVR